MGSKEYMKKWGGL